VFERRQSGDKFPDNKSGKSDSGRQSKSERRNKERRGQHRGDTVDRRYHDLPRRWSGLHGI
jgi:hypothetical protein